MKKLLPLLLLATLFLLPACGDKDNDVPENGKYIMIAEIVKIEEKIEVNVIESPVADGVYLVIVSDNTIYKNAKGKEITLDKLDVGDTIRITYSGQVMMSIPPQIVALSIEVQ